MKKSTRRVPRNYDGTNVTSRQVGDLLPSVLCEVGKRFSDRPDLVLASWPEVIGPKLAGMTQAVSFVDGELLVKVANSTLHSLLNQHDKAKILRRLKEKFPNIEIKNIRFRIG
ncbi:MAG: DUF721 domain-containing protein [Chlamydiales bacterium]|nr:DUF721 domain-containing protein [Chlamydiia bacterium]MCP5507292.1 DUF721 domain-containing protein [Chlamydiales bacterium]